MPVHSIVRVSFQSNPLANRAASQALTGTPQPTIGTGTPYRRIGTACYYCHNSTEVLVAQAMVGLMAVLHQYAADVDFVTITITRDKPASAVLFLIQKDFEDSADSGAGGMFQIAVLQDEFGVDISSQVDQGKHFANDDELRDYLAEIFKRKAKNIFIEEL